MLDSVNYPRLHSLLVFGKIKIREIRVLINVFVAHPIGGDVRRNMALVEEACGLLFECHPEVQPLAPYLLALKFLDDDVPDDRLRGIRMNKEFFLRGMVDELWLFGRGISRGMWEEVGWARELGIPVVPFTDEAHLDLIRKELVPGDRVYLRGVGPCPGGFAVYQGLHQQRYPVVDCAGGRGLVLMWGDISALAPVSVPIESPRRKLLVPDPSRLLSTL